MKLTSLMVALTLTLALSSQAAEKSAPKTKTAKPVQAPKVEKSAAPAPQKPVEVALTGSYIRQPIRRAGVVTDGSSPVVVLDRKAIENSGAGDLRELLVMRGLAR